MLKNLTATALSDALSRGVFFLFNVAVARAIEPHEFGMYGFTISLGVWLSAVTNGGLNGHGTRLLAQGADMGKTISAVLTAKLPVFVGVFTILIVALMVIPVSFHEKFIYLTSIFYVIGMSIFPAWIARARHANLEYMMTYGVVALFGVILLSIFLSDYVPKDGLTASLARSLSWLVGAALALWLVAKRLNFRLQWYSQEGMLRKAVPLGVANIIYNLIPLVPFASVRLAGTGNDLAAFSVMMQIQMVLLAGAGVFSSVLLPSYAKRLHSQDENPSSIWLIKYFLLLATALFSVFVFYVGWGSEIIPFMFGGNYRGIGEYLFPFGLAFVFSGLRYSFDSILVATGNYSTLVLTGGIAIALSAYFSYVAIQHDFIFAWVLALAECSLMIMNGAKAFIVK